MKRKRNLPPKPPAPPPLVSWQYMRVNKLEMDAWDALPKHVRESLDMESYQSPPFATGMRDALAAGFDWREFAPLFKKNSHTLYLAALRAATTPTEKERLDAAAEEHFHSVSFDPPRNLVDK